MAPMRRFLWLFFLSSPAIAAPCNIVVDETHARLERCGTVDVLELRGTPRERAEAKGRLLRDHLDPKVTDYFSFKVLDIVKDRSPLVVKGAELVYNQIVRLMHRNAPRGISEELDAMAAAMGRDSIYLKRAVSLPDTAVLLNALGALKPFRSLPAAGCTSVARKDGQRYLYGRNLDFAGAGIWDLHPLITIVSPPEATGELKHVVFGAHGVHFGGITGVNEAGISFAVHQNYMKSGSLNGVPMFYIGELVLREAKSLEEAVKLLDRYRPGPLWTFVLNDLKTGEAMAVESSGEHFAVRKMEGGIFAQTNHVMHQSVREDEFISLGTKLNSVYRMKLALEKLEEMRGSAVGPGGLARILSYQEDADGELSAYHDVLKAHTIQTVLLSASGGKPEKVYLSADRAPTAAGKYAAFDWEVLFSAPKGPRAFELVDFVKTPPEKRARQREIAEAFHTYFDQHRFTDAAKLLEGHASLDAFLFRAIAHYQAGEFEESLSIARQALHNPRFLAEPVYIRQSVDWVRSAALLRLGRTSEAKSVAESIQRSDPQNLRLREFSHLVATGKKIPDWMLSNIAFEFFSGDMSGRER